MRPQERCTLTKGGKSLEKEKGANSFISARARVLWVKTVVARSHQVGRKVRSRSSMAAPSRALCICTQPTQPARCKDERKEVQTLTVSLHVQESWLYDLQRVNKRPEGKGGGIHNRHVFAFVGLGT